MTYSNHVDHYIKDAEEFDYFDHDDFRIQEQRRRYEEIYRLGRFQENSPILEVGSGDGSGVPEAMRTSVKYFALDISHLNLKRVKNKYSEVDIIAVAGDVNFPPFKNSYFDGIIMSEVLEHLENPHEILKSLRKIINHSGTLIITVPYREVIPYHLCIHCNKKTPAHAHLHSFDEAKMNKIMNEAGFTISKTSLNLNKVAHRLYFNILIQKLPFWIWKLFDNLFNKIVAKPTSYIFIAKPG
jgi:2-polyprenyl-3-methyl-5-hydroxy-6-metoxy-1,4-benzoquinol methylase